MTLFLRNGLFSLLFLFSISLCAQNWLPFNTGRSYQYASHGEKQFYTLGIDSTQQRGNKTVYYFDRKYFNYDMRQVSGYFGMEMHVSADTQEVSFVVAPFPFVNNLPVDILYLRLKAKLGETWVFTRKTNQTISLRSKGIQNVLGEQDSVQVFVTGDNDTLVLSKTYGLLRSKFLDQNLGTGYLTLHAIKELNKGTFLVDLRRIFDFTPGDIFIRSGPGSVRATCEYHYQVDTILSKRRANGGDTVWYELGRKTIFGRYDSLYMGAPALSGYYSNHSKMRLYVTAHSWGPPPSFGDQILPPYTSGPEHLGFKAGLKAYRDTLITELYGFESYVKRVFVKGLGLVSERKAAPFTLCTSTQTVEYKLICWKTAVSTSPYFTDCLPPLVLDLKEPLLVSQPTLTCYPNPALQSLTVEVSESGGEMDIHLYDLMGASVLEQKALSSQSVLNVSSLANGMYTVIVKTSAKSYRYTFVKE